MFLYVFVCFLYVFVCFCWVKAHTKPISLAQAMFLYLLSVTLVDDFKNASKCMIHMHLNFVYENVYNKYIQALHAIFYRQ